MIQSEGKMKMNQNERPSLSIVFGKQMVRVRMVKVKRWNDGNMKLPCQMVKLDETMIRMGLGRL